MPEILHELADAELIRAIKLSDATALKTFYGRTYDMLFRFLWRRTRNHDAAEDLLRELFTRLWQRRRTLDLRQLIKAYLNKMAQLRNTSLRTALEKFSQLYGIDILFANALVEDIRVTADLSRLEMEDALAHLLRNTALAFKSVARKQLVLYRKGQVRDFDIVGQVFDAQTGETLPYANIRVLGAHSGTTSNTEGRFALLGLPAKPCSLQVDYIGDASSTVPVDAINLRPNLRIHLQQQALTAPEVAVSAQNSDIFQIDDDVSQLAISPSHFSDLPIIGGRTSSALCN